MRGAFRAGSTAWEKPPEELCTRPWPAECARVSKSRQAGGRPGAGLLYLHWATGRSTCRIPSPPCCLCLGDISSWGGGKVEDKMKAETQCHRPCWRWGQPSSSPPLPHLFCSYQYLCSLLPNTVTLTESCGEEVTMLHFTPPGLTLMPAVGKLR